MKDSIHVNVYNQEEIIWTDFGNYQFGACGRCWRALASDRGLADTSILS